MKKLIVILGPNGVGKTTAAKAFLEKNTGCAYVDADWCRAVNPFLFTPATKKAATENMYCMFKNYLFCEDIDQIIFPYAFHGERKKMFDTVTDRLKGEGIAFELFYIVLKCSEQENVKRCERDGREAERIERGMKNTFRFYDDFPYPNIITTELTPEEVAERIEELLV